MQDDHEDLDRCSDGLVMVSVPDCDGCCLLQAVMTTRTARNHSASKSRHVFYMSTNGQSMPLPLRLLRSMAQEPNAHDSHTWCR